MDDFNHLSLDPYIDVSISEDQLTASILLHRYDDQFACTLDDLLAYLKSHQVVYGVLHDVAARFAAEPKAFWRKKTVIARGEPAVDGRDGAVRLLVELDDFPAKPAEKEDGRVDFKEITRLTNVKKGQQIAERTFAQAGVPGKTVTGKEILPRPGKETPIIPGKNVVLSEDRTKAYAAIDGMIVKTDRNKINVFPVFEVNGDVDFRVGNIDFIGSVVIRGNILPGFRVKASGDVRVIGGVEAAEIEAEGSIHIKAGILGQNKGLIKAGQSVFTGFIQEGNVEAGEDVVVTQSIMHSNVRAGRSVICKGTKGLIVGGIVQAGDSIVARTVGNMMSTQTVLEVGVRPELRNELSRLRNERKTIAENLDKTEKALGLLDKLAAAGQLSEDKMAMRVKLNLTKKQMEETLSSTRERILEIEKLLEETEQARIEVHSMIYNGAKIVIGRYAKFIKDSLSNVYFQVHNGDISMFVLN